MRCVIGLDPSLTSPGLAVWLENTWFLYGFRKTRDVYFANDRVILKLLPPIPDTSFEDGFRFRFIMDQLCAIIKECSKDSLVVMEGYAFDAVQGDDYKLLEFGGAFKTALDKLRTSPSDYPLSIVAPTRWKSMALGKGTATKRDTVEWMKTHGPCVDLMDIFHSNAQIPPNPLQDIADACGIVLSIVSPVKIPKHLTKAEKKMREKKEKQQKRELEKQAKQEKKRRDTEERLQKCKRTKCFDPRMS